MKRWFLTALAALCVTSGAAASNLGPSYEMYVERDSTTAGDAVLITSVAIKRNGTRDKAPRLSYRSLDTTVASVTLTSTHTATISTKRAGRALVEGTYWYEQGPQNRWRVLRDTVAVTVLVKPDTVIPPPPDTITPPPATTDTVLGAVLVPRDSVRAKGGVYAQYEAIYDEYIQKHWDRNHAEFAAGNVDAFWSDNYYDRVYALYAQCIRGGQPTFCQRADFYLLEYRRKYLRNGAMLNGGSTAHWWMRDGLLVHYLRTGDDSTRYTMARQTDGFAQLITNNARNGWESDARIESRFLNSFLDMVRIKGHAAVPPTRYAPWAGANNWWDPDATWEKWLDWQLEHTLAGQSAVGRWEFGSWPCTDGTRYQMNFQAGLLNTALINVYAYKKDPRIIAAVKRNLDEMWATQWKVGGNGVGAFQYTTVETCPGDGGALGTYLTSDLTGLILPGFAWLYHVTGDVTYKTRAEQVLAATVAGGYPIGGKQFNQMYQFSWSIFDHLR